MILEHACLDVVHGEEHHFEEAFAQAQGIIASMPGFGYLRLEQCWRSVSIPALGGMGKAEDHTEGFRGSTEYQEWRRLLHHFYRPVPDGRALRATRPSLRRQAGSMPCRRMRASSASRSGGYGHGPQLLQVSEVPVQGGSVDDQQSSRLLAGVPEGVCLARRHQHEGSVRPWEHVVGDTETRRSLPRRSTPLRSRCDDEPVASSPPAATSFPSTRDDPACWRRSL